MNITIEPSWRAILQNYINSDQFEKTAEFIGEQYISKEKTVYPRPENIFRAFDMCPFDKTKVVIIGQDPYHGANQADGLAFSVPDTVKIPPSLKNIFKEIKSDTNRESICLPEGELSRWAQQGVLLLNSVLTVEADNPASHAGRGWEQFTDEVIQQLSDKQSGVVFMLWGAYAQKKGLCIDRTKHLVLQTSHPSPLGAYRGFDGCKHFSKCNEYLLQKNTKPITW